MKKCKICFNELRENYKGLVCKTCKNGIDRYGLNRNQQVELLESQNNKCALCEKPLEMHTGNNFGACIDHDHKTGTVRGVLCGHCNVALGKLECIDIHKFLKNIKNYLPL